MPPSSRIGIDPTLLPYSDSKSLSSALSAAPLNSSLVPIKQNLIDAIWTDKPPRPSNAIFRLDDKYTGESVAHKLSRMREKLVKSGSPGMVVSQLDEVAWLFNLRGSDIDYNPVSWKSGSCRRNRWKGKTEARMSPMINQVFFAYAILTPDECTLFTHLSSLDNAVRDYLHSNGIAILPYEQVWGMLEGWTESIRRQKDERASKRPKLEEDVPMEEEGIKSPASASALGSGDAAEGVIVDGAKKDGSKPGEVKEKIEKTDKVLIGTKTSWAIAKAVGEVSHS
jgi:Xaa-Pro aminopeptidase